MSPYRYSTSFGPFGRVFLVLPPPPGTGASYREDWLIPLYPWTSGAAVLIWQSPDSLGLREPCRRLLDVLPHDPSDPEFRIRFDGRVWDWLQACRSFQGNYLPGPTALAERIATEFSHRCDTGGEVHQIWNRGGYQDA